MNTKKAFALMAVAAVMLTGCGKQEEVSSSEPETLPVEVVEATVNYYQPESTVNLVPPIPLRLKGVSYEAVNINTTVFHFKDESFSDFLNTANLTVDGNDVKDIENSDFAFHGFALKLGNDTKMYAELTKDGELVEEFNAADESSYEIKAVYTSADLLKDNGNYFVCGVRIFAGLQKSEIESTDGKGYTSGFDENTFYYPDVSGWTLSLAYQEGIFNQPAPQSETDETDESAESDVPDESSELLDENGNPIPSMYLSELYLFRGDAEIETTTEY